MNELPSGSQELVHAVAIKPQSASLTLVTRTELVAAVCREWRMWISRHHNGLPPGYHSRLTQSIRRAIEQSASRSDSTKVRLCEGFRMPACRGV